MACSWSITLESIVLPLIHFPGLVAFLAIDFAEPVNSPMQQDSQVIAINSELQAHVLILPLIEEAGAENTAVSFREHSQDLPHQFPVLFLLHQFFQIQLLIGNICGIKWVMLISYDVAARFRQYVLT